MSYNIVEHMSPSAFMTSLSNPASFYRTYVLKVYDQMDNMSALVGKSAHMALEKYYLEGATQEAAIAAGFEYLTSIRDANIKYGKTGTREEMQRRYNNGIRFYFEEEPRFHDIVGVEDGRGESVRAKNQLTGAELSIPIKCVVDLAYQDELGNLHLVDHKFVTSYTKDSDEVAADAMGMVDFKRFIQGMFYYHWAIEKYGKVPVDITYNEVKVTKNRDGSPQLKPYVYSFGDDNHTSYLAAFYKLFETQIHDLNLPDRHWLPNPNDIFDGQFSFEMFVTGIQDIAAPTAVKHKTEEVAFVDRNYIPSKLDDTENKDLSDEERIRIMLSEHAIAAKMTETHHGPSVTKYTFKPQRGIKMSRFAGMRDDFAAALQAESVRVEAPLPGTSLVGIEVPAKTRTKIDLVKNHLRPGTLKVPIGVNVYGETIYKDLADAPHMLVAGATGAGKSVFINVLIQSLSKQMTPGALQFVMIDPKQVELGFYEGMDHLREPIITDPVSATKALDRLVTEMERRYKVLREAGVRKIEDYKAGDMPRIVVILDEFADLMMTADSKKQTFSIQASDAACEVLRVAQSMGDLADYNFDIPDDPVQALAFWQKIPEDKRELMKDMIDHMRQIILGAAESTVPPAQDSIIRIAQKARAVGIHLVLATQRPSADVVTGLLKANIPTKVCFATTNSINSRVVLDENGAEELTRMGDMLYSDPSFSGLKRLQGLYA